MENINEEVVRRAKLNSIGTNKKEMLKIRRKDITKKVLATLCAILITISISACSTTKFQVETSTKSPVSISNYDIDHNYVDIYVSSTVGNLEFYMKENDMEFYGEFNNSIDEYNEIKQYLKEEDVIIYYDRLGKEECNKILQTFGYNDINDYMVQNGYVDSNGEPSIQVLTYSTYERITQDMKGNSK